MKELFVFIILLAAVVAGHGYNIISLDLTTFFVFILIIGFLIYRDRRKVKLEGIVLIRRTQKGRDFIDKTAQKHPSFWKGMGVLGVVIAIPMLVLGSVFLIGQAVSLATGAAGAEGGVRLLLPGPVSSPTSLPGIFVVPWWIWIIGIAVVIIPHEFMHGIMCRLDKIGIKSVGWILLVIIPGAFVEPDERQLKKAKRSTKMKVYAAGSFANILIAFIVLVIAAIYFAASFSGAGAFVVTLNDTPASNVGLTGSITDIDGHPVRDNEDIRMVLEKYKPGDTVEIKTIEGDLLAPRFRLDRMDFFVPQPVAVANTTETKTFTVTLAEHPERSGAYLGVSSLFPTVRYNGGDFETYRIVATLLLWIYVFNLGIGIVNLLPIKPLDGGLLFEEIAGHFTSNTKFIVRAVSGIMLFVLIFNLLGPIFI